MNNGMLSFSFPSIPEESSLFIASRTFLFKRKRCNSMVLGGLRIKATAMPRGALTNTYTDTDTGSLRGGKFRPYILVIREKRESRKCVQCKTLIRYIILCSRSLSPASSSRSQSRVQLLKVCPTVDRHTLSNWTWHGKCFNLPLIYICL